MSITVTTRQSKRVDPKPVTFSKLEEGDCFVTRSPDDEDKDPGEFYLKLKGGVIKFIDNYDQDPDYQLVIVPEVTVKKLHSFKKCEKINRIVHFEIQDF